MKYVIVALITLFLTSCSGVGTETQSPAPILSTSTLTIKTQTPIGDTATAIAPLTSTPTVYTFPAWINHPDTPVLAALMKDDVAHTREIHFLNAATGEKYELHVPIEFSGFFWYDNMNFGLVAKDLEIAYKFNLQSGQIQSESISPQATRFLDRDLVNGLVVLRESSVDEITFDYSWQTNKSLNKLFTAQWDEDDKLLTVVETKTNQVIWEHSVGENRYGTEFAWSPVNENYLAFLEGSPEALNGFITESVTLSLVDVIQGKILSTFDGNFGKLRWSPDGKMILYQDAWFGNYGMPFKEAPCLLILNTSEKKCLRTIPRVIPPEYALETTGIYEWTNDSESIFYTYVYVLKSQYQILGNLCNYSLVDSHINCPTQDLEVLQGKSIINYDLSPDEQFIHFCYSDATILNDYADISNDGIINRDGSGFFSWVGTVLEGGPFQTCSADTLWRPLP